MAITFIQNADHRGSKPDTAQAISKRLNRDQFASKAIGNAKARLLPTHLAGLIGPPHR